MTLAISAAMVLYAQTVVPGLPPPSPSVGTSEGSAAKAERGDAPGFGSSPAFMLTAGSTSGFGLGYRQHFANRIGIHIAGLGFAGADFGWGNLAAAALVTMHRGKRTRFYGLFGVMGTYGAEQYGEYVCNDEYTECWEEPVKRRDNINLNVGVGVGMEFHLGRHFGAALELPLTVWIDVHNESDYAAFSPPLGGRVNVLPLPNVALSYYF